MNIYFVKSNATKPCLRVSRNRAKHSYISNIAAKYAIWENITVITYVHVHATAARIVEFSWCKTDMVDI